MLVCKNGEQREILKNTQVVNAVGVGSKEFAQTLHLSLDRAHS